MSPFLDHPTYKNFDLIAQTEKYMNTYQENKAFNKNRDFPIYAIIYIRRHKFKSGKTYR